MEFRDEKLHGKVWGVDYVSEAKSFVEPLPKEITMKSEVHA